MDHGAKSNCTDAFLQSVFNALLEFDGYDETEAGMAVTVRADLIETRRQQGMSAPDVARFLAAVAVDTRASIAGKGESELLRALREEEISAYELKERSRIASLLGLDVDKLSPVALQHMWEEIPVVIHELWNEKPWLSKQVENPGHVTTQSLP